MHKLSETQKLQEFTRFEPANFNNCSFDLPDSEDGVRSGWWLCGARGPGDVNFTMASPTRVELVEKGQLNHPFVSYTQYNISDYFTSVASYLAESKRFIKAIIGYKL